MFSSCLAENNIVIYVCLLFICFDAFNIISKMLFVMSFVLLNCFKLYLFVFRNIFIHSFNRLNNSKFVFSVLNLQYSKRCVDYIWIVFIVSASHSASTIPTIVVCYCSVRERRNTTEITVTIFHRNRRGFNTDSFQLYARCLQKNEIVSWWYLILYSISYI